MVSVFNLKELEHLLEDFYRITRIRITVFDDRFQELVSVPDSRPEFCRMIRSCEEGRRACAKCDMDACAYAANDLVLIALWLLALPTDPAALPMVICFAAFLANDIYGFVNWRRMQARQEKNW